MLLKVVFSIGILLFVSACQTHLPIVSEPEQTKDDSSCEENKQSTDINYLYYANIMIDALTDSKAVQDKIQVRRIKLFVNSVHNGTGKNINMSLINKEILNRINRSGMFILVNDTAAADYSLSGVIKNTAKNNHECRVDQEQLSIELVQPQTNTLFWSEKKLLN